MSGVFILLGGNLGKREEIIKQAINRIAIDAGRIIKRSSIYETESWGFNSELKFLNQVIEIATNLNPKQLLDTVHQIEEQLGRKRNEQQYASRTIDIDILLFRDEQIDEEGLQIPHPRMHQRKFTLIPLEEIAGQVVHPEFQITIKSLNSRCKDDLTVELYKGSE